jgi:hypothetical protein
MAALYTDDGIAALVELWFLTLIVSMYVGMLRNLTRTCDARLEKLFGGKLKPRQPVSNKSGASQ